MIFLPIGFGKWPSLPILSILLVVSIVLLSVPFFKQIEQLENIRKQAMRETDYKNKIDTLLSQKCLASGETKCVAVRKIASVIFNGEEKKQKELYKVLTEIKKSNSNDDLETILIAAKELSKSPEKFPAGLKALPGFEDVRTAFEEITARSKNFEIKHHFLNKSTINPINLVLAEFVHANWMHLIGNLLAFFALACVLEARAGAVVFLLIYFVGGSVGLASQLHFAPEGSEILLGASANISAVIGAALVYFYKRPMRCLFSAIVYNKIIECPTWIILIAAFFVGDVSGLLGDADGVAHIAHLSGFISGAIIALICKQFDDLGDEYLSQEEKYLHTQMKQNINTPKKLEIAEKILSFNPRNFQVISQAMNVAISQSATEASARVYLYQRFTNAALLMMKENSTTQIDQWISEWPLLVPSVEAMKGLDVTQLNGLAQRQLKNGNWLEAARFFDALRFYFPNSQAAVAAGKNLQSVLSYVSENGVDLLPLRTYISRESRSTLKPIIAEFPMEASHG